MAKTTRKCQHCTVDDTEKDQMICITKEGKTRRYLYYHEDCYPKFLRRQAFLEKEQKELDHLAKVIMKIYGVKVLPNAIFPPLQDLRNGNRFFGKREYNYKQGYSYDLIAETFEYVSDSIEQANATKDFKGGFSQAFRYGLAIVCDKLSVVDNRRKNRERQELMAKASTHKVADAEEFETSFKPKKKAKSDISDFLDD